MNKNGSDAFRNPLSYSLSTDRPNPDADGEEPPVKTLVPPENAAPEVSLAPTPEQQEVAAAHPVGEIRIAPADVATAPGVPTRRRPHIRTPRIGKPHIRTPHINKPRIPHMRPPRMHAPHIGAPRIGKPHIGKPHIPRMRPMRVHTFDSFLHRDYRFLWASTLFFSGAFWLQQVIIGWLTYELTQSALLTSLAMGLDALPILIAGPLGGLLVDRWDKRKLLAGVFLYQSLLALGFGALVLLGDVGAWHVFAFIFLMGAGWVIVDPARMSLIPSIVPRHSLVNAFALNSLAFSITRLAIPAVGGALLAFAGAGVALLLQATLVAAAAALALGLAAFKPDMQAGLSPRAALAEILEGVRYIRQTPVVLGLLLLGFLPAVLVSPFLHGLIPVYAAEVYKVGPATLGLLMSSVGAGFLTGTLLLASISNNLPRKGVMIMGCIALICVSMTALALNPTITLAYPIVALGSVGTMAFFSITSATMQSILPDRLRGRVSGIYIMTFGAMPAGNLAAGVISQNISAPAATLIAVGVIIAAATALMILFPQIRKL